MTADLYRKVGALIIRDRRMLLITTTMDPDVYSLPGGPDRANMTHAEMLATDLRTELGVELRAYEVFDGYDVTSNIDGARVRSWIYRAEINGELAPRQPGRRIVWADQSTQVRMSTTVQAVMADAFAAGLVDTGDTE